MLMMTETTVNLAQTFVAISPKSELREQQRYPYRGWYAVIVRSQREQNAADGFRKENVAAYWPNYIKQANAGLGRRRAIFAPLIPGMIFCPTADFDLFWSAVQRIPYVVNVLRKDGGIPSVLTNADIETIRRIEGNENAPPPITPVHNFQMGQKVRFSEEMQCQWAPGKIVRLAVDGRISVEVYLMGRMVPISVLPHQIERM